MSSRAKSYTTAPATRPVTKGHAKAEVRKRARQTYGRNRELPWPAIGIGLFAVLLVALLGYNFLTVERGKLSAQSTSYAFGDVPWKGGYVTTKFALNVDGDTTVNDIQST